MKSSISIATIFFLSWIIIFISCKKEITSDSGGNSNKPPIANAGSDEVITLPVNTVAIDGSGCSDPEMNIAGYIWTKISGPSVI